MPECQIIVGDCVEKMCKMPRESVQLVFADPPYNGGVDYGRGKGADSLDGWEYLDWCRDWMQLATRKLAAGGSMWTLINEQWADSFGISMRALMPRRQRIIWRETFCQYTENSFATEHRHLFYHVKSGAPHTWNPDPIRIESVRQKMGDKRAKGPRVPGSVWTIGRLAGTHTKRGRVDWHPAQLPIELLERIILCSTNPGDTVLDVFAGSGSMGVACKKHGRKFIGIELSEEYADKSRARIDACPAGDAKGGDTK